VESCKPGIENEIIPISDCELITNLVNQAFITVALQFGYTEEQAPSFPAFIHSSVISDQMTDGLKFFGFKTEGDIVGCAGYRRRDDCLYVIERLAVLPEFRRRGIGERLMKHIENTIKKKHGDKLEVSIVDNNQTLKDWYKRLGYQELRIEEYARLPFKVCVLQKPIGSMGI
jgi:ribosomal protein S18 acetylase RimI-like enzyme